MAAHLEGKRRTRSEMLADIPGAIIDAIQGRNVRFVSGQIPLGEVPEHSHDDLQIAVLFEPASCVFRAGKAEPVTIHGPAIVMIAPRCRHTCRCERAGDALLLYVERRLQRRGSNARGIASRGQ
jgi:hypothetical protein